MCAKSLSPTPCDSMDHSPPGSSVHGILQARFLEWIAMPSSRGSSRPRDPTQVSYISCTGGFFTTSTTSEAPQQLGCHFLFQRIFPTQELNPGLLHCRWILYRLNHQGSPKTEVIKGACSRGQSDMEASTLGLTSGVWFFINRQVRDCYVFTKPNLLFLLSIELDYNS